MGALTDKIKLMIATSKGDGVVTMTGEPADEIDTEPTSDFAEMYRSLKEGDVVPFKPRGACPIGTMSYHGWNKAEDHGDSQVWTHPTNGDHEILMRWNGPKFDWHHINGGGVTPKLEGYGTDVPSLDRHLTSYGREHWARRAVK